MILLDFSNFYRSKRYLARAGIRANPHPAIVRSDIFTGLEIESERWHITDRDRLHNAHWHFHEDGSLRGDKAIECVTYPVQGLALKRAIRTYCLETGHCDPFTWRCASHVHVDLMHRTPTEVQELIPLTLMADNFMYGLGDPERSQNYNCRPISHLGTYIEMLVELHQALEVLKTADPTDDKQYPMPEIKENERYIGTNWTSLFKHGTLEFRHFPGNNNQATLLRWVNACHALVTAAERPRNLAHLFEHDIEAWKQEVFPMVPAEALRYDGWQRDHQDALDLVNMYQNSLNNWNGAASLDTLLRDNYLVG